MNLFNEPEAPKVKPTRVKAFGTDQVRIEYGAGEYRAKALDVRGWETVAWSSQCPWEAAHKCVWRLINRREAFAKVGAV